MVVDKGGPDGVHGPREAAEEEQVEVAQEGVAENEQDVDMDLHPEIHPDPDAMRAEEDADPSLRNIRRWN